jgi:transcriptional regulator with XRE-family HTH domain
MSDLCPTCGQAIKDKQAMAVGQRIAEGRKTKRFTQDDLAKQIGVSRTQLANIEIGRTNTSIPTLIAIARALGLSVDYILGIAA